MVERALGKILEDRRLHLTWTEQTSLERQALLYSSLKGTQGIVMRSQSTTDQSLPKKHFPLAFPVLCMIHLG